MMLCINMESNKDKICQMNIMLWDREKEIIELKKQLQEKDEIIKELESEIYFSDLELEDMRQLVQKSCEVTFMNNIMIKVQDLSRNVRNLEDKEKETQKLVKMSEDIAYLERLNDRNDKLMNVNRYLMEQLYKGKVIYM